MGKIYSAFVLMSFSPEHKNTYELAIKEACRATGVSCHRLDESNQTVNLVDEVYAEIDKADIIIADLSGLNHNVLYETGYAFGVNKQIFLLIDNVEELPFNLRPLRSIVFDKEDLPGLKKKLSAVLRSHLKKRPADPYINPVPGEKPLPLKFWSKWGEITVFSDSDNSNIIVLQGTVSTAGYVSGNLDVNLAGKVLTLYINNTGNSKFSMNRLIKVTVNKTDTLLKPKTRLQLISNEYAPAADGRIDYVIPDDFDGKIGFVFYEAQLHYLRIAAFVK
jgi:hypothetical protein